MLVLFGPKSGKIRVYKAAFVYQGSFKEGFSAGSPEINEVVLAEIQSEKVHEQRSEGRYGQCTEYAKGLRVVCSLRSRLLRPFSDNLRSVRIAPGQRLL